EPEPEGGASWLFVRGVSLAQRGEVRSFQEAEDLPDQQRGRVGAPAVPFARLPGGEIERPELTSDARRRVLGRRDLALIQLRIDARDDVVGDLSGEAARAGRQRALQHDIAPGRPEGPGRSG